MVPEEISGIEPLGDIGAALGRAEAEAPLTLRSNSAKRAVHKRLRDVAAGDRRVGIGTEDVVEQSHCDLLLNE